MKAPESIPFPSAVMKVTTTPDYAEHYANNVRVGFTPFDLSLIFGLVKTGEEGTYIAENLLVRISPQQLKSLVFSLPLILAQWEENFGKIPLSENFVMTHEKLAELIANQGTEAPAKS
jgi:hypothetical protein